MAVTLTYDWQNIASKTVDTGGGAYVTFWLDAKMKSQNTSTNKSTIQTRLNTTVYGSVGGQRYGFWLTGSSGNYGDGVWWYSDTTVCTGEETYEHNADGSKTVTLSAGAYNRYLGFEINFSGDAVLPKINRGFTTRPTLNVTGRKPHSLTFRWITSEYCSKIVLSIGGTSTQVFTGKAKAGTFTVDGLTPDTSYTAIGVFTREDTGGTSNSLPVNTSTKKIAARVKVNGVWKEAMPYVRVNGTWKEAIPHIRVNNQWKEGI